MRWPHGRAAGDQQLQAAIANRRKFRSMVTIAAFLAAIIAVGIVVVGLTS